MPPRRISTVPTSEISRARRARWSKVIAKEQQTAQRQTIRAWHQGPPNRPLLSAADPPRTSGRYHRPGGTQTWYGSSSEAGAWAELARHTLDPVDLAQVRRRIGWADFAVRALDLTSPTLQKLLGVKESDLRGDDLTVCQTLADLAIAAGFEAVVGPSAALTTDTTFAVFGRAITTASSNVHDLGARTFSAR